MRTVSCPIAKLGLSIGDVVHLSLVNSVGATIMTRQGFSLDSEITINSDTFSIELLENDAIDELSKYKLALPNGFHFSFTLHSSFEDTPHDLIYLLRSGCYEGIIIETKDGIELDHKFLKKLDAYFFGEKLYLTQVEKDIIKLYAYYADEVFSKGSTIDIMRMMDNYLANITGE